MVTDYFTHTSLTYFVSFSSVHSLKNLPATQFVQVIRTIHSITTTVHQNRFLFDVYYMAVSLDNTAPPRSHTVTSDKVMTLSNVIARCCSLLITCKPAELVSETSNLTNLAQWGV